jgi:hypothetical protein
MPIRIGNITFDCWTVMEDPEGNEFCIAAKSFTG